VTLTIAHHSECKCGEGGPRQYILGAIENNVPEWSNAWVRRLNEPELALRLSEPEFAGLVYDFADQISHRRSSISDLFGPWHEIEEDNRYTFRFERNKALELGAFKLVVKSDRFYDTLPLEEPQLLEFLVLALGLKFKETLFGGCMQEAIFHTLKEFVPRWQPPIQYGGTR